MTTTFTPTVQALGPVGTDAAGQTVCCLQRHHYGLASGVQPMTAAFFLESTGTYTLVAFNPNGSAVSVNWWNGGDDAATDAALLTTALSVPANWFGVASYTPS